MKNNKKHFVLLFLFTFSLALFAQQRQIKGTVKDEKGEAIIGATIIVKGTTTGTTTDIDGNFTLNLPAAAKTLLVSFVGMEKKEVDVKNNNFNVVLTDNSIALNEVVAIGYGTQRKKDLTGSVSSVSEKALRDIPVSSAAEAITGKLPGVQVTTTEGSPDAQIKIRVRGGGSITQSNTPLYIVDGFPMDDISNIAPSEIQTIDVLKDASSTAIYGSRGANGVIIVTTKAGKDGKISISYTGYAGFKQTTKQLKVLTPFQFAQKQYEGAVLNNSVATDYDAYFGSFNDMGLYNYVNGTNWQNEIIGRTGNTRNHNFTISGGSKQVNYNVNLNRLDDKAIMYMSNFNRTNASLKLNLTPWDWFKGDFSARYSVTVVNGPGANDVSGSEKSTSDSRIKNAVIFTPLPLKNLTTQDDNSETISNLADPFTQMVDNDRYQKTNLLTLNTGFTIKPSQSWSFSSTFGYSLNTKEDDRYFGLTTYFVTNNSLKRNNAIAPACTINNTNNETFTNANTISFKKDNFIKNHNISIMVGQENLLRTYHNILSDIEAFPSSFEARDTWKLTTQGTTVSTNNFYGTQEKMISFFSRLNYDYKGIYYLSATFREDGSSKFGAGNRWGEFPSVSGAWRLSDEGFMKNSQKWLSNLKLRASYGTAGNNNIPNGSINRVYTSGTSIYLPSTMPTQVWTDGSTLVNPDLKWETTITRNVGLDYGFFNNRISGTLDFYKNSTKDLLLLVPLGGVGYTSQWQNTGHTSNQGGEFSINIALIQKKDFTLNFGFNISINRNKVIDMGGLASYAGNEGWTSMTSASNSYLVTPGQPVGLIYGYVSDGMYSADDFTWNATSKKWVAKTGIVDNSSLDGFSWGPGAMKLKDIAGAFDAQGNPIPDGKITDADRTIIGNTNPKHFGSFNFSATYKGWDATINCNWVYGNNIYNANKIEMTSIYYKDRNMLSIMNNAYTQIDWTTGSRVTDPATLTAMNANASMWSAPNGSYAITSWAIEDGSFLRISNLTIGYTLPKKLLKILAMQQMRFYASINNLYTFTKYSGYDPEVDTRRSSPLTPGVDYSSYPKSHSYNLGVNITF